MSESATEVMIVEDEPKLAQLLQDYLRAAGFATRWIDDGLEAIRSFRERPADLLVLDLMLPGCDGLDVCRELRAHSRVPIVMLTARVEEIDRLLGLELGADDYICKPFSPREVVARVRAVLRRAQPLQAQPSDEAAWLRIDEEGFSAYLDGHRLELTPVEFRLLRSLASSRGRVFSRAQLLDRLYDDHRIVTDRTVDSHVKNLRRKLQEAGAGDEPIRSIYGVGYRLEL